VSEPNLSEALANVRPDDLRIDEQGRVVITAPTVVDQLKAAAKLAPDVDVARNDTNIICCGNTTCGRASELGSLVERFVGGTQGR